MSNFFKWSHFSYVLIINHWLKGKKRSVNQNNGWDKKRIKDSMGWQICYLDSLWNSISLIARNEKDRKMDKARIIATNFIHHTVCWSYYDKKMFRYYRSLFTQFIKRHSINYRGANTSQNVKMSWSSFFWQRYFRTNYCDMDKPVILFLNFQIS